MGNQNNYSSSGSGNQSSATSVTSLYANNQASSYENTTGKGTEKGKRGGYGGGSGYYSYGKNAGNDGNYYMAILSIAVIRYK